jgi:hypothetical protein
MCKLNYAAYCKAKYAVSWIFWAIKIHEFGLSDAQYGAYLLTVLDCGPVHPQLQLA